MPALFFALVAGSAYVLARLGFGLRRRAALLAAALVGAHNLLLWVTRMVPMARLEVLSVP